MAQIVIRLAQPSGGLFAELMNLGNGMPEILDKPQRRPLAEVIDPAAEDRDDLRNDPRVNGVFSPLGRGNPLNFRAGHDHLNIEASPARSNATQS